MACRPASGQACVGDDAHVCNPDGTIGGFVRTCAVGQCVDGFCTDPCGQAASYRSYVGCEYWPVDLDNAIEVLGPPLLGSCSAYAPEAVLSRTTDVCYMSGFFGGVAGLCDYGRDCSAAGAGYSCTVVDVCILNAQQSPFAVVVANPDTSPASVTLENATGRRHTVTVAPGAVQAIFPQSAGFPDQSLDHSGIERKAYRLTSDRPIVAYQFNPLDNVGVFSNDASLLLPEHTFDRNYYVIIYPTLARRPATNDYSGYATVVASRPGTTRVTVRPTARVRAGLSVPSFGPGGSQSFTLSQFETLNIESASGGDLTGTEIVADQPVGVFVGHEATVVPIPTTQCCADHLEDQLFPASTWGRVYAIARSQPRGSASDLLRVMAQRPGTNVTFSPPVGSCTLGPGEFCEVSIGVDVEVSANEPILVAHYLLSTGGMPGDPAIAFAVPTEQYRTDYTFLVPMQYMSNYISVVASSSGAVLLDGSDVRSSLAGFASGTFVAGRIPVSAGTHRLVCPNGCGIEVYGWSTAVSYLFAGGLDLQQIVVF